MNTTNDQTCRVALVRPPGAFLDQGLINHIERQPVDQAAMCRPTRSTERTAHESTHRN
jgi:hypothetical protein